MYSRNAYSWYELKYHILENINLFWINFIVYIHIWRPEFGYYCNKHWQTMHNSYNLFTSVTQCMTAVSPFVTHWRYCSLALSHPCHLSHQFHISKIVLVNKTLMINQKQISESSPDMSWKQTQQTHITQEIVKVHIKQLTIQCKLEYKIWGPLIAECASQPGQDDKVTGTHNGVIWKSEWQCRSNQHS